MGIMDTMPDGLRTMPSGKYGDLLDMVSFVVVLFYILTITGVFILRKNIPMLKGHIKQSVTRFCQYFILFSHCVLSYYLFILLNLRYGDWQLH